MNKQNISYSPDKWSIIENEFNDKTLGKCEVIMALGNGYMGMRSATEENYFSEKRNTFIAGTFNKASEEEVTELPNVADVIQVMLSFNGQDFNLKDGKIHAYERKLNLKTGELIRTITWEIEATGKLELTFKRCASMDNKHLLAQSIIVKPLDKDVECFALSGIDGQVTNSGAQHFLEGEKRLFNQEIMTMQERTTESNIDVLIGSMHVSRIDNEVINDNLLILMDRRKIFGKIMANIKKGSTYELVKYSIFETTRDFENDGKSADVIRDGIVEKLTALKTVAFDEIVSKSAAAWNEELWSKVEINIDSSEGFDQVAPRFAQYHLQVMTPTHDNRMGIGAKGLTGEGYKGHSFWDTEVFMFPYFLYTNPKIARQLLEYRYLTLNGARKKAADNDYLGAMYPWESAWLEDGEVTPVWGAADIVTGKATKIWSGFIEQHITADIAFAIYQYYNVTNDVEFMNEYGYEILFETAIFWASRVALGDDEKYHINNVIGPDEYKEHIDDNAFTNYLVELNFELAIKFANLLKEEKSDTYKRLDKQLDLDKQFKIWENRSKKMYLPVPNENDIIPQDSTYLQKEIIDLTKYKNQEHVGLIFTDYNLEQVNNIQVSKQADIMMLFYLRENLFSNDIKKSNWNYYESKTLHDSSLSLSTHCIIANDMKDYDMAYDLFTRCRAIDLGQNMKSSDHGIHAASLGGMLQTVINGFGGIRVLNGELRVEPHLPENWESLEFVFNWQSDILKFNVSKKSVTIENTTKHNEIIEFNAFGSKYVLSEKTVINLTK